ncbi:MAG: hypothetical protein Kow0037_19240 [Calditrichia bacterium]
MKALKFAIFIILCIFTTILTAQEPYREVVEIKHSRFHKFQQISPILFRAYPVAVSADSFALHLFTQTALDIHSFQLAHPFYATRYSWEVLILDSAGRAVEDISWTSEIRLKDFQQTNQRFRYHLSHNSLLLPAGKYKILATLNDVHGRLLKKLSAKVRFNFRDGFYASPPLFYTPDSPEFSNTLSIAGLPTALRNHLFFNRPYALYLNFFNLAGDSTRIDLQLHQVSPEKKVLWQKELAFSASSEGIDWQGLLPWQKMEEGEYLLNITYVYGKKSYRQRLSFQVEWFDRHRSLLLPQLAIEPLRLLLDKAEFKKLFSGNEEKDLRAFRQFWKEKDPDSSTAFNPVMAEFYARIDTANVRWGGRGQYGWRTEIGRIYVLNGPPDQIEDNSLSPTNPHLIWIYHRPDRNLRYIFRAVDGRRKYQLIKEEEF